MISVDKHIAFFKICVIFAIITTKELESELKLCAFINLLEVLKWKVLITEQICTHLLLKDNEVSTVRTIKSMKKEQKTQWKRGGGKAAAVDHCYCFEQPLLWFLTHCKSGASSAVKTWQFQMFLDILSVTVICRLEFIFWKRTWSLLLKERTSNWYLHNTQYLFWLYKYLITMFTKRVT